MARVAVPSVLAAPRAAASERALATAAVLAASASAVVYWLAVAAQRWRDLTTNAFDLGFFDQIVWNTAHGRLFATTFVPYNFAGQHLEPVLLLFAAAYRATGAGPTLLVATQAVVAGAAALPLFAAAGRLGLRPALAAAVAAVYLANPYLHRALLFDFHPETMVALPAFLALWAAACGRHRWAAAAAVATLLLKEDAAFVALALGGVLWWRGGRREAAVVAVVALVWAAAGVGWLMPLVRGGHPSDLVERYGAVTGGRDGVAALAWMALHPLTLLGRIASHVGTAAGFIAASAPLGVLAPWALAALVPGLALALLSSHPPQAALQLQYAVELVPLAATATLLGARVVARRFGDRAAGAALIAPAIVAFLVVSPVSPLAPPAGAPPTAAHRAAVAEALARVPPGAPVAAQSGLVPRLSQRQAAWEFPAHWRDAEWVVVDAYGQRSTQSLAAGYDAALASVRAAYVRVFAADGVTVFERPAP